MRGLSVNTSTDGGTRILTFFQSAGAGNIVQKLKLEFARYLSVAVLAKILPNTSAGSKDSHIQKVIRIIE